MLNQRFIVAGLVVATSAYVFEITLVPLLLPTLQRDLLLSRDDLVLVANCYSIAVVLSVMFAGWLGDQLGAARVFTIGIACFALGGLIVSFAPNFPTVLAGRMVQGGGGGLFSPMIPVLLARVSGGRPGRYLVLWNSFSGLVVAMVPILALPVLNRLGWEAVMLFLSGLALVSMLVPQSWSASGTEAEGERAAPPGEGPTDWHTRILPLYGYVALNYGTVLLFLFLVPLWLVQSPAAGLSGPVLGIFWASFTLTGFFIRNAVDGPWIGTFLVLSPVLVGVGSAAFLMVDLTALRVLAGIVVGAGFGLGNAPSTTLILRYAPQHRLALASSLDVTFARLGSILAIAFLGSWSDPLLLALAVLAICAVNVLCALPFRR